MISPSQRPLPNNTQHSQQTDIHAPGGIRTHNLSRRAVADLRLRPRGHWDRQLVHLDGFITRKGFNNSVYFSTAPLRFAVCRNGAAGAASQPCHVSCMHYCNTADTQTAAPTAALSFHRSIQASSAQIPSRRGTQHCSIHTPTQICITVSTNLRHRKVYFYHLFTIRERLRQTNEQTNKLFQTEQQHFNANSGGNNDTMSKEAPYNRTCDPYRRDNDRQRPNYCTYEYYRPMHPSFRVAKYHSAVNAHKLLQFS